MHSVLFHPVGAEFMSGFRLVRIAPVLAVLVCLATVGCGDSESQKHASISPEFQKKTEDYLKNYQNQMYEQHKGKAATKKR
jgi:hypothetical protein